MKRSEKEAIITEVAERASRAVANVTLPISPDSRLQRKQSCRREFRKIGGRIYVVKNTLMRKALERITGYDRVYDKLAGPTGIAFAFDDPAAPAKVIKKFSEKTGKFQLKAAVVEKTGV